MILVKIKKWKVINNLEHVSTTWEIASDENFDNILETHEQSDMLELLFSTIEVPKDVSYWVRAKRHFNASGVNYWLKPVKVTNMEESYGNMLMAKDAVIQQPYVYIEPADIMSAKKEIVLKASRFYSNVDQHESTSWFVFDSRDNLLWHKLNDKVNKEQITIPNLPIYKNKSKLKFIVIYKGVTGTESKAGVKIINNAGKVNYEIETTLNSVTALTDLVIKLRPIIETQSLGITNIYLTEYSNPDVVVKELELSSNNTITVPWHYLKNGMKYTLKITASTGSVIVNQLKNITVEDVTDFVIKDPLYEYRNEIKVTETYDCEVPEGIYVEALVGGMILIPSVKHDKCIVHTYDKENDVLVNSNVFANGINLISDNIDGFLVKPISRNRIVIDQMNSDGHPSFLIYDYDNTTGKFTLKYNVKRTTESGAIGKTGAIIQSSNTELLYNPIGSDNIRKLNVLTGEVTDFDDIPLNAISKGILIRCKDNRVFVGNSESFEACIINHINGEYTLGYSFGPSNFINNKCLSIPMINGNTLIVCNDLGGKNPTTNFSLFDYKVSSFKHFKILLDSTFESVIINNNGYIMFTNRIANETATAIKTKFRIFR